MGRRLLKINVDLIISFLKGINLGSPRYFEVTKDPIPDGTRVISIRNSPYQMDVVELELDCPQWEEVELRTEIRPQLRTVSSEDMVKRMTDAFRNTKPGRYSVDPIEYLKQVYDSYGLDKPNSSMTKEEFVKALLNDIENFGTALIWLVTRVPGDVAEIWPISVAHASPQPANNDFPSGYYKVVADCSCTNINARQVRRIVIPGDSGPYKALDWINEVS